MTVLRSHAGSLLSGSLGVLLGALLLGGVSYAANGGGFLLGRANSETATATLTNTAGVPLALNARTGTPPLKVNSRTKVVNLDADLFDGLDSSLFLRTNGTAANAVHAGAADSATNATHAGTADSATNAGNASHASTADSATNATHAGSADSATTATSADDAAKLGGVPLTGLAPRLSGEISTAQALADKAAALRMWDPESKVLKGGSYSLANAHAVAFDGTHVWVGAASALDELNPDGSLVHVFSGSPYNFSGIQGIAFDGTNLWITNSQANTVTEVSAANGAWEMTLASGAPYNFDSPSGIAFDGTNLWIANAGFVGPASTTATVVSAASGAFVTTVNGLDGPTWLAYDGSTMWISSRGQSGFGEVDGFAPGSFAPVATISESRPGPLAFDGTDLWVSGADSVSVYRTSNQSKITTITYPASNASCTGTTALAFDGVSVWASYCGDNLVQIDAIRKGIVGGGLNGAGSWALNDPEAIAYGADRIWVANYLGASVTTIDTRGPQQPS